jgi:cell division protein ZapA (FtsZ GTPase activity inhibitor)
VSDKDYPTARVVLEGLASEVRVRTYHLPLASYPDALKQAARLLDQKKTQEANQVLATALSTLVIVDRVKPLPTLIAKASVDAAQKIRQKDKDTALKLLAVARSELDRAKELGYAGNDPEYLALDKSISDVEKQIKSNGDSNSVFASLRQKVDQLFKKQSESPRK